MPAEEFCRRRVIVTSDQPQTPEVQLTEMLRQARRAADTRSGVMLLFVGNVLGRRSAKFEAQPSEHRMNSVRLDL